MLVAIMPDNDVRKDAVTNNSQLKLLFRLLDFKTEGLGSSTSPFPFKCPDADLACLPFIVVRKRTSVAVVHSHESEANRPRGERADH